LTLGELWAWIPKVVVAQCFVLLAFIHKCLAKLGNFITVRMLQQGATIPTIFIFATNS